MPYAMWLAIDDLDSHKKRHLVLPVPFWDNILEISLSPCSVFTQFVNALLLSKCGISILLDGPCVDYPNVLSRINMTQLDTCVKKTTRHNTTQTTHKKKIFFLHVIELEVCIQTYDNWFSSKIIYKLCGSIFRAFMTSPLIWINLLV